MKRSVTGKIQMVGFPRYSQNSGSHRICIQKLTVTGLYQSPQKIRIGQEIEICIVPNRYDRYIPG